MLLRPEKQPWEALPLGNVRPGARRGEGSLAGLRGTVDRRTPRPVQFIVLEKTSETNRWAMRLAAGVFTVLLGLWAIAAMRENRGSRRNSLAEQRRSFGGVPRGLPRKGRRTGRVVCETSCSKGRMGAGPILAAAVLAAVLSFPAFEVRGAEIILSYSGKLEDPSKVNDVSDHLYQVCVEESIPVEYVAKPDLTGKGSVCGVSDPTVREHDWIEVAFDPSGKVAGRIETDTLGLLAHRQIVNVLQELEKDIPDLRVADTSGYWDRSNSNELEQAFGKIQSKSAPEESPPIPQQPVSEPRAGSGCPGRDGRHRSGDLPRGHGHPGIQELTSSWLDIRRESAMFL